MPRPCLFIGGCDPIVIRVKRNLGIDHQAAIAGQMDDHVGLRAGAILAHTTILNYITMTPLQTRRFEDPFQNQFTPVTLGLVVAFECAGQILRLGAQGAVQVHQLADLLGQGPTVAGFFHINVFDLRLKFDDAGAQWVEKLTQAGLVLLGEALALFLQNLGGEGAELMRQ